jgi:hypothetical protein
MPRCPGNDNSPDWRAHFKLFLYMYLYFVVVIGLKFLIHIRYQPGRDQLLTPINIIEIEKVKPRIKIPGFCNK